MSAILPSYRYQPGINNNGDASLGDQYVFAPSHVNDANDVSNYGYNSTLLNTSAKFGSADDAKNPDQSLFLGFGVYSGQLQNQGRRSWRAVTNRNKSGISTPKFANTEEMIAYYNNFIQALDPLTNKWELINGNGAGYWADLHQVAPRYEWTGGGAPNQGRPIIPNGYPRLSGLYDQDLSVNTNLIQIGYIAQKSIVWQAGYAQPERLFHINLYENFTNQGSAKFKAVNEAYFFNTSNPAAPSSSEREKIYKNMWAHLYAHMDKYLKNMFSSTRVLDLFFTKDSRVSRQAAARQVLAFLDPVPIGGDQNVKTNSNWQYVSTRTESLDAWIYVSGSYNLQSRTFTLHPDYLYLRLACPNSGARDRARLPDNDPKAIQGAIYR